MAFNKKVPEWKAAGSEPPSSLKQSGFQAGYKPPADYFNWFMHDAGEVMKELQSKSALLSNHQVETYTTLSGIGLTDSDMNAASAESNFLAIFNALPARSELWLYTSPTIIPNLQASIGAKLIADLGISSPPTLFDCRFEKVGAYTLFVRVTAQNYHATNLWHLKEFNCVMRYSEGNYQDLSPFILSRDPGGFYGPANKPTAADVGARPNTWMPSAADVKALPVLDATSSDSDMDAILTCGSHCAFYKTGEATLGTPYKAGKTVRAYATILSYATSTSRGMQIAFCSGSDLICARKLDGSIGQWGIVYTENMKPKATDIGALPIDGSEKMTGSLKIKNYGEIDASNTLTYVKSSKDINNFRYLRIINPLLSDYTIAKAIQWGNVINGSEKTYSLHGEHNKPGGSYSGNNSATARTVETGGIGYCILIWRDSYFAFVTALGAIVCNTSNKSLTALADTSAKFIAGTLTLATTDGALNASGKTYSYQVL